MVKLKKFYNQKTDTYRLSFSGLTYEHVAALEDLIHLVEYPCTVQNFSMFGIDVPYQRVTSFMRCKRLKSGLFSTNNSLLSDFQRAFEVISPLSSKEIIINPFTNNPLKFNYE